jgi:CRP-like cAMP-binding protein
MKAKLRFVGPLERTLYLRSLEQLRDLTPAELAVFAQKAQERFFRKGTKIFHMEEGIASLHLIVEGRVRVRGGEHGDTTVGPGRALGLWSLLARSKEGFEAVAETDTISLEVDADSYSDILEDNFSILHHTMRTLAARTLAIRRSTPDGTYFAPAESLPPPPERELDLIERLLYWTRGGAYQRSSMDALIELARNSKEVRFQPGTALWRTGEPSGFVYLILAGTVRCALDDGQRHFRCGPGYPLGNVESLSGEPRWFDAVVAEPVVLLHAETDAFLDVLEDHFQMARDFLAGFAAGLIRLTSQENTVGPKDPEG